MKASRSIGESIVSLIYGLERRTRMTERKKTVEWLRRILETIARGFLISNTGSPLPYAYQQTVGPEESSPNLGNTRETDALSSQRLLAQVFDACLLVGVYIVQNGKFVYANDKLAKIFGYPKERLIGMPPARLFHVDHRNLEESPPGFPRRPSAHKARGVRNDGELFWIRRSEVPIAHNGSPAILGNVVDLTPEKRLNDVVLRSKHELKLLSEKLLSAQEQERKRIASELHDTVGQYLSAIKFSLDNVNVLLEGGQVASGLRSLRALLPVIQEAIFEVRRISMDLRPAILDDLGLLATLSWHCRTFQDIYANIAIEKQIEIQEGDVPAKLRTTIYRIVQEALNNVAKHAKADRVVLGLGKTGAAIELIVTDNGCGFDVGEVLKGDLGERGLGLAGMRQRCESSGGSLHIDSSSGTGTIIRAVWPS